ncbi:hypothetical protein [Caulobacter sp.]|uniref:hypothetical protein n=1 Tax=Caulobacter sp. TaxID=78 RepID=UPI001B027167|nr:hypothetical protein [Caulobacter sp.]MBO9543842.1 hypothetical protein [Caulobacter sp.]
MTSRLLAALVATMSLASTLPAVAAPPAGVEGTWRQWMTCSTQDDNFKFFHQIKIYRDRDGLRFVGNAPLNKLSNSLRDPTFAGNYYGAARLDGDILTLRVSERYKRDYQNKGLVRYGVVSAQDATYRLTASGELIAQTQPIGVAQGGCQSTPLKRG